MKMKQIQGVIIYCSAAYRSLITGWLTGVLLLMRNKCEVAAQPFSLVFDLTLNEGVWLRSERVC